MTRSKKKNIKLLIAAGTLAVILVLLLILRTDQQIAEWMATNLSRKWIGVASRVSSVFSFSLYETFLYVAIISILALLTLSIVFFAKKQAAKAVRFLAIILIAGLAFGNVYTLSAGFTYYREQADLPQIDEQYFVDEHRDQLFAIADFMFDDFNKVARAMQRDEEGRTISPYTHDQLADKLIQEYKRLDSDYFSEFTPKVKTITSKNIMSHMHICGVFFAPFGEANVNPLTPPSEMPVTMAHELAHAKGVMRESDANLVAYWLMVTSDDEYLRYSGYKACYSYIFSLVADYDVAKASDYYQNIDQLVKKEWRLDDEFWASFTLLQDVTTALNDFYLKLQGQEEGTGSYYEPTLPPSEIVKPNPDGDQSGGGDEEVVTVYNLNTAQRVLIKAIQDRMNNE